MLETGIEKVLKTFFLNSWFLESYEPTCENLDLVETSQIGTRMIGYKKRFHQL